MAKGARPMIPNLGNEVELLNVKGSGIVGSIQGLFDGICKNAWNDQEVCYWNTSGSYIEFETDKKINIWRSGTEGWKEQHKSPFRVLRYNGVAYVEDSDIMDTQFVSAINHLEWEKTLKGLVPGKYRLICIGTRIDSEWYIEEVEEEKGSRLTIHKTLRENLPTTIPYNTDEIHITEDRRIHISDKNGNMVECITTEVKEISNPLTTSPLEYGYFKMSADVNHYKTNSIIPFDTVVDGNMPTNNGVIKLKAGKTYHVSCGMWMTLGNATFSIGLRVVNVVDKSFILGGIAVPVTHTTAQSGNDIDGVITPQEDMEIAIISANDITLLNAQYSNLVIQEVRNNPVNQYGGFEIEALFDGSTSDVGKYELSDDVNHYDCLLVTYEMKRDSHGESLVPVMTSNTEPAPYAVRASSEYNACYAKGAFDGIIGSHEQTWYSAGGFPQWLEVFCGLPTKVLKFSICNGSGASGYSAYPPKTFKFQGSHNGIDYDDLLEVVDMPMMKPSEEVVFELDQPANYSYYRWYFIAGYNSSIIIGEVKLFGQVRKIENTNIILPDQDKEHRIVIDNKSIFLWFDRNKMLITYSNGLSIKKVLGIKGQIPSLLVGGEF